MEQQGSSRGGQAAAAGRHQPQQPATRQPRTATQLAAQPSKPAPYLPFRLQRATDGGCTACGVAVSLDPVLAPSRAAVLGKHACPPSALWTIPVSHVPRRWIALQHRALGDTYVKEEFHLHKKCTAEQARVFRTEWVKYRDQLQAQLPVQGKGGKEEFVAPALTAEQLESMNDEQRSQLMELRSAAYDPQKEGAEGSSLVA
jgi:hypothetical protein